METVCDTFQVQIHTICMLVRYISQLPVIEIPKLYVEAEKNKQYVEDVKKRIRRTHSIRDNERLAVY